MLINMDNVKTVYTLEENIRILSIIVFTIVGVFFPQLRYLSLEWGIIILILGNNKRIPRENGKVLYFIRMTLYFTPYLLPAVLNNPIDLDVNYRVCEGIFIAVVVFGVWFFLFKKGIRLLLSDQMIAYSYRDSWFEIVMKIYSYIGAAISEELYFRLHILSGDAPILLLIFLSVSYFFLCHYILPWRKLFTRQDHINQLTIGAVNVCLFFLSDSIIPCIILHLLINSISIIRCVKQLDRHYIHPERYEKFLEESLFGEMEL